MVKLSRTHSRWHIPLSIIEGGSGIVHGLLAETDQTQIPAYTFVNPRRILRTNFNTALKVGMVVRSPSHETFIVGENGASDYFGGTLWQSWRLFEASGQYEWTRRTNFIDPVTHLPREGEPVNMGKIWIAVEPMDREAPDRRMRTSHEQDRFICGADIRSDDIVHDKKVIRVDKVLGVQLGMLSA